MLLKSRETQLEIGDVVPLFDDIADKRQEHFVVLTFNSSKKLISKHLVFLGTVNSAICHPREIFAVAIADAASSIVIGHNHPSGESEPSTEDIEVTKQFVAAGVIMGIPILDHIVVVSDDYFSFFENGLLE